MEIKIRDDKQIVEIWLTSTEKNDPSAQAKLKPLYQTYKQKKYTVAVFESGCRDLYTDFRYLAQQHRRRMAEHEVQCNKTPRRQNAFAR